MNGQEPLATCWGILCFYRNIADGQPIIKSRKGKQPFYETHFSL